MMLPFLPRTGRLAQVKPNSDFELHLDESFITYRHPDGTTFADITGAVRVIASNSGVKEGFIVVRNGGKSAVVVQEARQFVEKDIANRLNAHGSGLSAFQTYQALPISKGTLSLGPYQSVLILTKNGKPELTVFPVPGRLETRLIDTGNFREPLYRRNKSNYAERGSVMIFDITDLISGASMSLEPGIVYAGTGNTTCVPYHDTKGEGVEGLVKRMDAFAPPELHASAYLHNNLSARVNIPPDERQNGRAHVIGAVLGASVLFPVSGPKGKVYLVELDGPRKLRSLNMGFSPLPSLSKAYK